VEAVFRAEIFRIFFDDFLPERTGSWQESTEKNLNHIPVISGVFL
jgi:hypothetical protein